MAFKFKFIVPNGLVTEKTVMVRKSGNFKITDEKGLCKLIYWEWKKKTDSKSFQDWADELNADDNFDGIFTKEDALDNLASTSIVEVNNKPCNLCSFFKTNYPESLV